MQLSVGPVFGFGGEVDIEVEAGGQKSKSEDDLETTIGFQLGFQYPLHDFFSLGAVTAFRWVNTEDADSGNIDPSVLIAINVAPRARYVMLNGDMELYLSLPVGIDITVPNSDLEPQGGSLSSGVNFSLGFFPGVQYFLTDMFGIYAELGFRTVNLAFEQSAGNASQDTTTSGIQFHMNFGGAFAF